MLPTITCHLSTQGFWPRTRQAPHLRRVLREIPFWGWAAGDGLISLDRTKAGAVLEELRGGVEELPAGWSISIYPEGTRSEDGRMGPLRRGIFAMALHSRLPIIPIGSWGAAGIVPRHTFLTRSGPIEVTVGKPLVTTDWKMDEHADRMAEIRAALSKVTEASRLRYEQQYGVCEPHRYAGSMLQELLGARPAP